MRTFGMEVECVGVDAEEMVYAVNEEIAAARAAGRLVSRRPFQARYGRQFPTPHTIAIDEEEYGIECRLPPLLFREWPLARVVLRTLRNRGAHIDRSNGGHIHFGWDRLQGVPLPSAVAAWMATWKAFDPTLRRLVHSHRRTNGYCRSGEAQWSAAEQIFQNVMEDPSTYELEDMGYRVVGSAMIPYKYQGTTEVRLHQGTLNATAWYYWARLMHGLLDFSEVLARAASLERLQEIRRVHEAISPGDVQLRATHLLSIVQPFMSTATFTKLTAHVGRRVVRFNS